MTDSLQSTVVAGGYCIGCGACTAVENSNYSVHLDERGRFQAKASGSADSSDAAERVCPFSDASLSEDTIGADLFERNATFDNHIGYHIGCYAGYVKEGKFRERGSSGGFGKWILFELLRTNLVDSVIQLESREPDADDPALYSFSTMNDPSEVLRGSRSVYYPVEMSEALSYIRETPGRYAITGIPCFVKAIRQLSRVEPVFRERILYCVGVICGHLKSSWYADMLAWQMGVQPGNLAEIDFRKKLRGTTAKQKGVEVRSMESEADISEPDIVQNLFGTDYNLGLFQYRACDFCDDVVGETADISVGDAWLPRYIKDGRGTSLLITRNRTVHDLLVEAEKEGRISLDQLELDEVVSSQRGGFRQRREGLAYRLYLSDAQGTWRPPKRVQASSSHIGRKRKRIYQMRMLLTRRSYELFKEAVVAGDFELFRRRMGAIIDEYHELYQPSVAERIRNGVRRRVRRLKKYFTRHRP